MKYLNIFLAIFSIQAGAETCAPATQEMAQYFHQATWRASSVTGEGVQAVQGFVDGDGNFRFANLSRGGNLQVKLSAEAGNREFFRYCREGSMSYLGSMRRSRENHIYKLSARFLPSFAGLPNNPFETSKWRPLRSILKFVFNEGAVEDGFVDKPRAAFVKAMSSQINAQKEFGVIELDLTGWDDLVCDLVQGRIGMSYEGQGVSESPLISQRKVVEPADVRLAYQTLKAQPALSSKEVNVFVAGRILGRLEQERRIGAWGDKQSYEVFKKLAKPDLSGVGELDEAALQCASDQLQIYAREIENNHFNFRFLPGSLDDLEGQVVGKK